MSSNGPVYTKGWEQMFTVRRNSAFSLFTYSLGRRILCMWEDCRWEICLYWYPMSSIKSHRRNLHISNHRSLLCLTKPQSGCAPLKTSQVGHKASDYGKMPIKTTLLSVGAGQHPLGGWWQKTDKLPDKGGQILRH